MAPDEFESRWHSLSKRNLTEAWFDDLRLLYVHCDSNQHAELRRRLGWDATATPTIDPFCADWTDKTLGSMESESSLLAHIHQRADESWAEDWNSGVTEVSALHHAMILAGYDPDAILGAAANSSRRCPKEFWDGVLRRKDLGLALFGLAAVRLANGEVRIQVTD